jgi:2,5-diamino-6-(ribosylamino)-4(3H)-pyrimidinone 5'-phosphate reductase
LRPFVFINVAVTADGKMDTFERKGAGISSEADKKRVQILRAEADAVMVGGHTLLDEDPGLVVKNAELRMQRKAKGMPENPMKVGIVSCLADLRNNGNFMMTGPARRVIFTTSQTSLDKIAALSKLGAEVYIIGEKRVNLQQALEKLFDLGIRRLMVEGGGTLNFELMRLGLADELYIYMAPKIFGGQTAPTLAAGPGLANSGALSLKFLDARELADDEGLLIRYRFQENTKKDNQ